MIGAHQSSPLPSSHAGGVDWFKDVVGILKWSNELRLNVRRVGRYRSKQRHRPVCFPDEALGCTRLCAPRAHNAVVTIRCNTTLEP
jgi:hypothetical protein